MPQYSGLWDGVYGQSHTLQSQSVAKGNGPTALTKTFANKLYSRAALRELIIALTGTAPGATASATHKRRLAVQDLTNNVQGGLVAIETFTDINRATTSGDATMIDAALAQSSKPTYPKDKSGVGGGGKLGY